MHVKCVVKRSKVTVTKLTCLKYDICTKVANRLSHSLVSTGELLDYVYSHQNCEYPPANTGLRCVCN